MFLPIKQKLQVPDRRTTGYQSIWDTVSEVTSAAKQSFIHGDAQWVVDFINTWHSNTSKSWVHCTQRNFSYLGLSPLLEAEKAT